MYGTVARLRLKPGMEERFRQFGQEAAGTIPGLVFQHVYRTDADPQAYFLVVGFASKEAYHANAGSAEQQGRYEQYRQLLEAEPEWHDGEIVFSAPA